MERFKHVKIDACMEFTATAGGTLDLANWGCTQCAYVVGPLDPGEVVTATCPPNTRGNFLVFHIDR